MFSLNKGGKPMMVLATSDYMEAVMMAEYNGLDLDCGEPTASMTSVRGTVRRETEMEMKELLDFMDRLREAFPCDKDRDWFGDYDRCHVSDVARELNMPIKQVWDYVGECSHAGLIDNNGGTLRFNNSLYEDLVEFMLLRAFATAENKYCGDVPIGFIYKVIRNMYRNGNHCAGKLAVFTSDLYNNPRAMDELALRFGEALKERK